MPENRMEIQGYAVLWGNGFAGLYGLDFTQLCNTPERDILKDALSHGVKAMEILTPAELDQRRGYSRPTMQQYLDEKGA